MLVSLALLGVGTAGAVRPARRLPRRGHRAAAAELERLNARGEFEAVLEHGARFSKRVEPAGVVTYEMAYAANRQGQLPEALALYDRAIDEDPDLAAAFYDRGELLPERGDDADARADFLRAAALRPDHWAVHFRLAHMAGRAGDPQLLQEHLMEALRHGFDFRTITSDPDWRAWARNPKLGARAPAAHRRLQR